MEDVTMSNTEKYEAEKKKLQAMNLTADEYEKRIMALAKKYKV